MSNYPCCIISLSNLGSRYSPQFMTELLNIRLFASSLIQCKNTLLVRLLASNIVGSIRKYLFLLQNTKLPLDLSIYVWRLKEVKRSKIQKEVVEFIFLEISKIIYLK